MKEEIKILDNNINRFKELLVDCGSCERRYFNNHLKMISEIQTLINNKGVSANEIIKRAHIPTDKRKDYLCGNWEYTVRDISIIHQIHSEVYTKEIQKENDQTNEKD
jgi:hypothetical protein